MVKCEPSDLKSARAVSGFRSGLTIIEVVMVLGLLGVFLATVSVAFQSTRERMLGTSLLLQLNESVTAARQFAQANGGYAGINEHKLVSMGAIKGLQKNGQVYANGNPVYLHALNTAIQIRASDSAGESGGAATHFSVALIDVPASVCNALVRSDVGLRATTIRTWGGVVLDRPSLSNMTQVCGSLASLRDFLFVYS